MDLTENDYTKLAAWAARGLRQEDVARCLGIHRRTFGRIIDRDPKAAEAWETGRSILYEKLVGNLVDIALNPKHPKCVNATFGLLNNCYGWSRGAAQETIRANVQINLPAPMSREAYAKAIAKPNGGEVIELTKAEGGKVGSDATRYD